MKIKLQCFLTFILTITMSSCNNYEFIVLKSPPTQSEIEVGSELISNLLKNNHHETLFYREESRQIFGSYISNSIFIIKLNHLIIENNYDTNRNKLTNIVLPDISENSISEGKECNVSVFKKPTFVLPTVNEIESLPCLHLEYNEGAFFIKEIVHYSHKDHLIYIIRNVET